MGSGVIWNACHARHTDVLGSAASHPPPELRHTAGSTFTRSTRLLARPWWFPQWLRSADGASPLASVHSCPLLVDQSKDFLAICTQMRKDPDHGFLHRHEMVLAGLVWFGVPAASYATFGAHATLWYIHVPQVLTWHSTMSVNSAMHTFGYARPGEESDHCRARNVPWLWSLSMGEAWHANHHGEVAASFEGRWWEFDPVYRMICIFEKLGLVWNVRRRSQPATAADFPGAVCVAQMLSPLLLVSSLVYLGKRRRDTCGSLFPADIELANMGKTD